jgi:hypothetical protein
MKVLQIQTLPRADMVKYFSAIPNEYQLDSHFMFSESYEPTLRKEIEQAVIYQSMKTAKLNGGTPRLSWKQVENKKSHSIRYTCTAYYVTKGGYKNSDSLSYTIYTLLA